MITRNTPRVQISPEQLTLWVLFTFKGIFVFFVVVQENNVFWKMWKWGQRSNVYKMHPWMWYLETQYTNIIL